MGSPHDLTVRITVRIYVFSQPRTTGTPGCCQKFLRSVLMHKRIGQPLEQKQKMEIKK